MNVSRSLSAVPLTTAPGSAGPLTAPLALVDAWAGAPLALLLGGSHATGAAAWVELDGRSVCLSDLDVYAVVGDRGKQRAAVARARAGRVGLRRRLMDWGFAAPLEASFLLPDDLRNLPARPATLELAHHGVVVKGDASWRDRIPRWGPGDVGAEEIQLLLENRAFELLLAWPDLAAPAKLPRLLARHAVLKCALDVVRVAALERGEYPDGAMALVAHARRGPLTRELNGSLEAALSWRAGTVVALESAAARSEWLAVAEAWCGRWRERSGSGYAAVRRQARRARLRRRLRRAVDWPDRSGRGPALVGRLRHALQGTPQHRVNAAAATLLLAAVETQWREGVPALPAEAARTLEVLGVAADAARRGWPAAARAVVEAWDGWVLDGQRTAEPA